MFALIINWIVAIRTVHLLPNQNNDVCDRPITSEPSNHLSFHQIVSSLVIWLNCQLRLLLRENKGMQKLWPLHRVVLLHV